MSLVKQFPALAVAVLAIGATAQPAQAQGTGVVITDISLEGVAYDAVEGLLTATGGTVSGTFAGLPFTTDVENFALQLLLPDDENGGACSVLNLELGPIDLDLLGLHVDTSPICLEITAFAGEGLLGDLLCGLAGGNLALLQDVLDVLPGILTESLDGETDGPGPEDICDGECVILDLALGPVDLTLLGLNVYLHDCDDGPVQVCVSASQGQGLLGDLLCGLAGGGTLIDLDDLLRLIDAIVNIPGIEDLDLSQAQMNALVRDLRAALRDGDLSTREINRLVRTIGGFLR
jgi:hypothetical protein